MKKPKKFTGKIVVGYDRRFQSDSYAKEIAGVLQRNGLSPLLSAEPLPTPAVSFASRGKGGLGVVVTASHNSAAYNGIKIKLEGKSALPDWTKGLESCLEALLADVSHVIPRGGDGKLQCRTFRAGYLGYLKSQVPCGKIVSKLKSPVVVDYLYGSGTGILEEVLRSRKIIPIHDRHDPLFGGLHPEPIEEYLGDLKKAVVERRACVGLAVDGDADRLGVVNDRGEYMTPCQVFPLLLDYLLARRKLKGKVVQSVSMGYLSKRIALAHSLPFEETPVGFKFMADRLASGEAAVGGEESGGYAWKGTLPERDGCLSALLFLEMLTAFKKPPSKLYAALEKKYGKSCYKRVDYRLHKTILDKHVFTERTRKKLPKRVLGVPPVSISDSDGLKVTLANDQWLLIRPSGTEPLIRTYAETASPAKTQALLDLARQLIQTHL